MYNEIIEGEIAIGVPDYRWEEKDVEYFFSLRVRRWDILGGFGWNQSFWRFYAQEKVVWILGPQEVATLFPQLMLIGYFSPLYSVPALNKFRLPQEYSLFFSWNKFCVSFFGFYNIPSIQEKNNIQLIKDWMYSYSKEDLIVKNKQVCVNISNIRYEDTVFLLDRGSIAVWKKDGYIYVKNYPSSEYQIKKYFSLLQ